MQEFGHRQEVLSPAAAGMVTGVWPQAILRTKLLAPRPALRRLRRPRLLERMEANLAFPATLIAANAGSGKTTLAADFVRTRTEPYVWYQLDHTDADPAVFLRYLAYGIRQNIPTFGAATFAWLEQDAAGIGKHPEQAADVLLNEMLDQADERLLIVLDDYHQLGPGTAVHRIVERLLAYLPDLLHLILVSRDLPPFQVARLRTQGTLAVIDRNDLLFTAEETTALFGEVFGLELEAGQLSECRERMQGWVTGLQLVSQVAQRGAALRSDLDEVWRQSELDIFDYFAEEVFADESPEIQNFLTRAALLDRIEPDLCAAILEDADVPALLASLVRRNLFLTVKSDARGDEFRLHPLFQTFLRRRFRQTAGRVEVATEEARIADELLRRHRWEEAIGHLLAAEEFARAAEVLAGQGHVWLQAGAFGALSEAADALPVEILERFPRVLVYRAEVERLRGDYDAAERRLHRVVGLLREQGDGEGEAEALHSLSTIARRRGDLPTAFENLDRAEALSDERSRVRVMCGNTRGLCLLARGDLDEAARIFRHALQAAEDRAEATQARVILHNLGLPAMMRGDFNEALRWLRRLFVEAETPAGRPHEAAGYLNMARCHLYRGELAETERFLERAAELSERFHLSALRGEILETYGNLWRDRNDAARAEASYDQAARAYAEAGIDPMQRELMEERAVLAMTTGDPAAARLWIEPLIAERRAHNGEVPLQTARLTLARILISEGKFKQAHETLASALECFRRRGLYFYEAQAQMAAARCELAAGREAPGLEAVRRALELAARYDYDYWLRREAAAYPEIFAAPEVRKLLPLALREEALAAEPAAPIHTHVETLPRPVADLTIRILGPVEIYRDPLRPFASDAWTTRRAREIFCYLAVQRGRRATRDRIIETFWGEAEFEMVQKNFHPTISHIRKALNSNQIRRCDFLLHRDGHYLLNPDHTYSIDVEDFDRLVAEGDRARRNGDIAGYVARNEEAVRLYRGDFFAGGGDTWVEEKRAYYREQYLLLLESLARAAQQAAEWPHSIQLAREILREDPCREDIHRLVMLAHGRLGNRSAVREQYEELCRLLEVEMGIEPESVTRGVYRQLLGEDPPARHRRRA